MKHFIFYLSIGLAIMLTADLSISASSNPASPRMASPRSTRSNSPVSPLFTNTDISTTRPTHSPIGPEQGESIDAAGHAQFSMPTDPATFIAPQTTQTDSPLSSSWLTKIRPWITAGSLVGLPIATTFLLTRHQCKETQQKRSIIGESMDAASASTNAALTVIKVGAVAVPTIYAYIKVRGMLNAKRDLARSENKRKEDESRYTINLATVSERAEAIFKAHKKQTEENLTAHQKSTSTALSGQTALFVTFKADVLKKLTAQEAAAAAQREKDLVALRNNITTSQNDTLRAMKGFQEWAEASQSAIECKDSSKERLSVDARARLTAASERLSAEIAKTAATHAQAQQQKEKSSGCCIVS